MRWFILALAKFFMLVPPLVYGSLATAQPTWPPLPSRLNFETPYGTLGIKSYEYIYESRLHIDNVEVTPTVTGLLNITYAVSLPKAKAALVSISHGDTQCPFQYRWILLHSKGYTLSPSFGSCSERIQVAVKGHTLLLETPNIENPDKIDIYIYDGKVLKRRRKAMASKP